MSIPEEADVDPASDLPVVDRVFTSFLSAVACADGYADVAKRLRMVLLDNRDLSEAALERALFDGQPS